MTHTGRGDARFSVAAPEAIPDARTLPVPIVRCTSSGAVVYGNAAAARLLGLDDACEFRGRNLAGLCTHTGDAEELLRRARRYGRVDDARLIVPNGNGRGHDIGVTASRVGDEETDAVYDLVLRDLDDDASGTNESTQVRDLEAQLRQAQKLEAIGQLAGGIAHDFNNLLVAIMGNADLLAESLPKGAPAQRFVSQIEAAADRAARLVNQLLTFSRKRVNQPEVIDLNASVYELESILARLIGENIDLRSCLHEAPLPVEIDPVQLEQVLINLVTNARDAMPEGGLLTISTGRAEQQPGSVPLGGSKGGKDSAPPCSQPGSCHAEMTVTDTGEGMDTETLQQIFDPFFTTKGLGEGTGLGLATVYGIVREAGGTVAFESSQGGGTTARVLLPFADAAPARTYNEEPSIDPHGDEMILLVEDEGPAAYVMAEALRSFGYTVLEASNGEAALRCLRESGAEIDLVVTDVMMPKMDGPTLVKRLRKEEPGLKVLFASGYAGDTFMSPAAFEQMTDLIEKPFSGRTLAEHVRRLLDR